MRKRCLGFTLIELMIVVAIIAVVAAIAIPNMLRSKMAANEAAAVAALHTYASGQAVFHRSQHAYATPFYRLCNFTMGGEPIGLIDSAFAMASTSSRPRAGYWFQDISISRNGQPYVYAFDYGLGAVPASYNQSGLSTFIIDVQGTVYMKDIGGVAATAFPSDPAASLWVKPE